MRLFGALRDATPSIGAIEQRMSTVATYTGSTLALLAALTACARPTATRPPRPESPQSQPPTEPAEPPAEPPAPDEPAEPPAPDDPARERRHGASVTVAPPVPPRDEYDVWGDPEGTPIGEAWGTGGLGCPRGTLPPPPSYVRGGRRSLVRLRSATVVDGSTDLAQRLLAGRAATLRLCHLEAMDTDPTAAGDLRLRLDIGANGGVLAVVVEASALPIDDCARKAALQWRFPKDEPATITATFELRTEPAPPERPTKPRCRP